MDWLNEYMEAMAQQVIDHGGVIDKYIGDSIMAIFGVPLPRKTNAEISRDAVNAVNCALAMERTLLQLNSRWREQRLPTIGMRIGIFTGPLALQRRFSIDIGIDALYSAFRWSAKRQEAENGTSMSDRRRRIRDSPVGSDPERCRWVHAGIAGVS
jgi:hypothetical protein